MKERTVCNAIVPNKDVDGFHVINVGRFCLDLRSIIPATPAGVIEMLKRNGESNIYNLILYHHIPFSAGWHVKFDLISKQEQLFCHH